MNLQKMINNKIFYFLFINLLLYVLPFHSVKAQFDMGIPGVTGKPGGTTILRDYEAIGVNPSNLGWDDNKRISFGIANIDLGLHSKALSFNDIYRIILHVDSTLSSKSKVQYSKLFNTKDGLNLGSNITWAAFSVNLSRLGGISFSLRDRINFHFTANQAFADVLFNGVNAFTFNDPNIFSKPISQVYDGTDIRFLHTREFNIAYGVRITNLFDDFAIYGGIGYRYIWGLGLVDIHANGDNLTAVTSLSSSTFKINTGVIDSFKIKNPNYLKSVFNSGGQGSAFDIGGSIIYKKKLKIGMSLLDMGSIVWNKNTMVGVNSDMKPLDNSQQGLKSFNVFNQIGYLFDKSGLFQFQQVKSYTYSLPSKYRMGAGLKISKMFEVGADMIVPLKEVNGYKDYTYYSAGFFLNVFSLLKLNAGVSGNTNTGWYIPAGLTISTKGMFEIYIATNDVLSYLNRQKNPIYSFTFCALRFNIGKKILK